jgi:hypothetical protein
MRRSICYCEPSQAKAGEVNSWKFIYTTSSMLPKGTRIKFDPLNKGRDIDWEVPSVSLKKTNNVIYGLLDNGKILQATEIEVPGSFAPIYEFILPASINVGGNFIIVIGSPKGGTTSRSLGTRSQTYAQRRRSFHLYIDPSGKGHYSEPETFSLDVKGNQLKSIRILSPSFVTRNKRFDVIVRFEDDYGNLTNDAPDDTLIELSHEHLRENLNWKLFVPETGFISLPNLYFNEPGVYTITLLNTQTKEAFKSPPIKCFSESVKSLFWGILHGESERIDSTENIESCLRHFRDDRAMNFYGASPFENVEETSNDTWKLIVQNVGDFNEADRFTTFLGFQWIGEPGEEGIRHIIYAKDSKQLLRRKDIKYNSLKKIYKSFSPKEILSIPCFTMAKGYEYNFEDFDPDFERVVEIYNSWGSSECSAKEGNPAPIQSSDKKGVHETAEGSIQKALQQNHRFGFVAGGLDDRGIYEDFYKSNQEQYLAGLTAIIAPEHSHNAFLEALYNRSCYATTGQRIILGLYLAGHGMGSEVTTAEKPGLVVNRHLSGFVAGTTTLQSIELIRNGEILNSFACPGYSLEFTYDDMTPLASVALTPKDKKPPFVYYYLRVIQKDGQMAWSSPIWVDLVPIIPGAKAAAKRPTKSLPVDFEEDEEDEEDEDSDELSIEE